MVFNGRLHPERASVTIDPPRPFIFEASMGHVAQGHLAIYASQIVVSLEVGEPDDVWTMRNAVQTLAASIADIAGWIYGGAFVAEITSFSGPESVRVFPATVPVLVEAADRKRVDVPTLFALLADPISGLFLRRALGDLRSAILTPDDTAFFCFRAVEALVRSFGQPMRQARAVMCRRLRVDDAWIVEYLQRPSNEVRHGAVVPVSDEDRQRLFLACREVIERYMILVSAKLDILPMGEFPRLTKARDPLSLRVGRCGADEPPK